MKKSKKEIILDVYSFDRASLKYIPAGGELLRFQGSELIHLTYTRPDNSSPWKVEQEFVVLESVKNYEPLSGTYEAFYSTSTGETKSFKMIPEGFSFEDSNATNHMERFVPMSLHFSLIETENYYNRLRKLYDSRDTMPIEKINEIVNGNQEETIQYRNNLVFVLDNKEKGICAFRINKISTPVKNGRHWTFGVDDNEGNYFPLKMSVSSTDPHHLYINNEDLGLWKIIDIQD